MEAYSRVVEHTEDIDCYWDGRSWSVLLLPSWLWIWLSWALEHNCGREFSLESRVLFPLWMGLVVQFRTVVQYTTSPPWTHLRVKFLFTAHLPAECTSICLPSHLTLFTSSLVAQVTCDLLSNKLCISKNGNLGSVFPMMISCMLHLRWTMSPGLSHQWLYDES